MLRLYTLSILLHAYVALRVVPDLPRVPAAAVLALVAASAVLAPLGMRARRASRTGLAHAIAYGGLVAIGLFSSLVVLTLARDAVLAIAWVAHALGAAAIELATLRQASAIAVPTLAVAFTAIGFYNARRRARIKNVDVPIENLPTALHGFTIAQISDVHIGPTIRGEYLAAVVDAVNELEPDLIAVTGDLVDGSVREVAPQLRSLSRLAARHGAYFVTGNHEYYSGAAAWIAELERLGLSVLMNEHVVVDHDGAAMVVGGVTDYGAHHFDPRQRSDPAAAIAGAPAHAAVKVLLAHQPRSAFKAEPAGFDLQLSGHTHGGQFLPWNFFVRLQQPFTAGLHRLGRLWVYVSRGTGYWGPPKRLGAPSEITALRLVAA